MALGAFSLRRLLAVGASFVLAIGVWLGPLAGSAGADTQTFATPGTFSFQVPNGVTSLTVTATGGGGGSAGSVPAPGGAGAVATATVPVTPCQTLFGVVGAAGVSSTSGPGGSGGSTTGGNGGNGTTAGGGGGGGVSGFADSSLQPLIAAGGGGGGGNEISVNKGDGGAAFTGTTFTTGQGTGESGGAGKTGSQGGTGGTATAGTGGAGSLGGTTGGNGASASIGVGGTGGTGVSGGGGGGGGFFSGGGGGGAGTGASAGGGGAGSSFVVNGATGVSFGAAPSVGAGSLVVTFSGVSGPSCVVSGMALCGPVSLQSSAGNLPPDRIHTSLVVPTSPPPPAGAQFPCGLIGFEIHNLSPGQSVTVTETLPVATSEYFKFQNGAWTQIPATFSGNQIHFTLTDGGTGDADGTVNGTIVDPGGPATPLVAPPTFTG